MCERCPAVPVLSWAFPRGGSILRAVVQSITLLTFDEAMVGQCWKGIGACNLNLTQLYHVISMETTSGAICAFEPGATDPNVGIK